MLDTVYFAYYMHYNTLNKFKILSKLVNGMGSNPLLLSHFTQIIKMISSLFKWWDEKL